MEEGKEKIIKLRKKMDSSLTKPKLSPQQEHRLESAEEEYAYWSLTLLVAEAIINIQNRLAKIEEAIERLSNK